MNYNIDGTLVPSYLIERNFYQKNRDFILDSIYFFKHVPKNAFNLTIKTANRLYTKVKINQTIKVQISKLEHLLH